MIRTLLLTALVAPGAALAQNRPPPPPSPVVASDTTAFICYTEAQPELVGGLDSLQARIEYPPDALAAGVEGMVVVQ